MIKRTVWKYKILIQDHQTIEMPFGAEILTFQLQQGIPTLWVLVEPTKEIVERRFRLAGTGHSIFVGGLKYIGTIKMLDDTQIYHLFEY